MIFVVNIQKFVLKSKVLLLLYENIINVNMGNVIELVTMNVRVLEAKETNMVSDGSTPTVAREETKFFSGYCYRDKHNK